MKDILPMVAGMPSLKTKKELQSFLGIINYLCKVSPKTAEVYELLQKLISVKADWTQNGMHQVQCYTAKKIVKKDACMKFYGVVRLLFLETNASSIALGVRLIQVRDGMNCSHDEVLDNTILHLNAFTSRCLSSAE